MDSAPRGDTPHDRILAAARRVITSRGLPALSVQTVATEAGVTKSAIAYHFGSKDGMVLELIGELADQESEEARRVVGQIQDPAERFSAYMGLYLHLIQTSDHWRLAFALWPTSHLDEKTRMFASSAATDLEALHLSPEDPAAQVLLSVIRGGITGLAFMYEARAPVMHIEACFTQLEQAMMPAYLEVVAAAASSGGRGRAARPETSSAAAGTARRAPRRAP
jgi:AcrR family transcriptional regulator